MAHNLETALERETLRSALEAWRYGDKLTDEQALCLGRRFKAVRDATSGMPEYALANRAAIADLNKMISIEPYRKLLLNDERSKAGS